MKRLSRKGKLLIVLLFLVGLAVPVAAQDVLPRPEQPFKGHMGLRAKDSVKDFPEQIKAPEGAPNIFVILTDDVGFGASSTFGGPVPTPAMDRLGNAGLRYNSFHTTALCSPTRAALLSGRNHHTCATGIIMEGGTGFPGYNTVMPKSCGTVAEILKQNGYNTAWFGKNHNVPDWQSSQAGPFDLWPTGLGFEYFYGFIGGDTNQWAPALFEGTKPIEPPHDQKDYFFEKDMADKAIERIRMLNAVAPDKPFLLYYAPGTAHAPHHAPKDWIAKFKGKFDQGWDKVREESFKRQKKLGVIPANAKLTPRPKEIPAWKSLKPDQKKVYARMMEVYAAALSYMDTQINRIIDTIDDMDKLDNTLVIYIQGDNGASAEGGLNGLLNEMAFFNAIPEDFNETLRRMDELGSATTFNHFPAQWAHAMDAPFQWTKQVASHFGGTRNGLVISWPKQIKDKGGIRQQFHHVIDIMPTILEAVGLEAPAMLNGVPQKPVEGLSMVYSFDKPKAPSTRRTQYFEMLGNRAIYNEGWIASTTPAEPPWISLGAAIDVAYGYKWELYNLKEDFTQANNVAKKYPEKLRELQDLFWVEAARYNVLPLDNSKAERMDVSLRPSLTAGRTTFTYYPGMIRIPEGTAVDLKNRSFTITAYVEIPESGGAEGMLITQGGRFGGYGFFLKNGVPVFHYNLIGIERYEVAGKKLSPGKHTVVVDFDYDGGGLGKGATATILVDNKTIAKTRLKRTIPIRISLDETLDCGEDTGTPVVESYKVPFKFTGELKKVVVKLKETKLSAADKKVLNEGKAKIGLSE